MIEALLVCFWVLVRSLKVTGYIDPIAKRVVVSRDVIFEEGKHWDWDVSYEEKILVDLDRGDDNEGEEGIRENEDGDNEDGDNADGEVGETSNGGVRGEEDGPPNETSEGEERVRQPLGWMNDYVSREGLGLSEDEANMALAVSTDPLFFEDAVKSANWRLVIYREIKSIEKNKTWTLTKLLAGAKRIGVKWVYKTKFNEHGEIDKHKARLVAKGYF